MISTNIDLTENRDFSRVHFQWLMQNVRLRENGHIMSTDMYRSLSAKEKLFGIARHESIDIFRKSDEAWAEEMRTHCQRCGKELRIPWKRNNGVCEECNSILEKEYSGSVFPWRRNGEGITQSSRDNPMDIFHMK